MYQDIITANILSKITYETFDNGLAVLHCEVSHCPAFIIQLCIHCGSRYESKNNNGISHLLEHMMFRGTTNYPSSTELAQAFEALGGEYNAETTIDKTAYWFSGNAHYIQEAFELLTEFIIASNYSDFETEKRVVIEEINNDYNSYNEIICTDTLAMQAYFTNHPLGLPLMGTKDSIEKISIRDLIEYKSTFYQPKNSLLGIISPYPFPFIKNLIQKTLQKNWKNKNLNIYCQQAPLLYYPGTKFGKTSIIAQENIDNQYSIQLLFPAWNFRHQDYLSQIILEKILCDGMASRFFQGLREKKGIVYDISCNIEEFDDTAIFSIHSLVSQENLPIFCENLKKEILDVTNNLVSESELNRIKERYTFEKQILNFRIEEKFLYLMNRIFLSGKFLIHDDAKQLKEIQSEDIKNVAHKIFASRHRVAVIVGPNAHKNKKFLEKIFL